MTEAELIDRCRAGNSSAWNDLFEQHYAPVGRFIFQLSPDLAVEDVEEISQETFLSLVRSLSAFRGGSQLRTWIFRIAINKTRDFLAKRTAAKRGGGQSATSLDQLNESGRPVVDPPVPGPAPDQTLIAQERASLVQRALTQLPDPCREILELRYFGDLSYEEIGVTLGLRVKTVSSRLSKCLQRLERIAQALIDGEEKARIAV